VNVQSPTTNTLINVPAIELPNSATFTQSITSKLPSINENAYKYFDLGEDVSKYQEIDPIQGFKNHHS